MKTVLFCGFLLILSGFQPFFTFVRFSTVKQYMLLPF